MHEVKGPFILICNHVTNLDMIFVACSFKEYIYFVASEHTFRAGFASRLLRWVFDPIGRTKASVAAGTVMDMGRRLKAGHSIGIFAEGLRTANGLTDKIMPASAKAFKIFNVPVITYKLHGGYLSHPRWGYTIRRGYMEGEIVNIYSPEELKKMSVDEFDEAINRDLYEDAYEWNKDRHIAYKGRRLAEGLEFELVACPKCKALNSLKTKDDRFWCDCGLKGKYDEYGMLSGEGFEYDNVTDWDAWEREYIANLPDYPEDKILAKDEDQTLNRIDINHNTITVDRGVLSITSTKLQVGNTVIPLSNISLYDIILQGYLLFSTKDGTHYEIHDSKHKFAGFLYYLLIKRYKP
ncbi:MAG: 1-acyl-sn-glycerol-3-phosphate acyltransferase [Lachnospiraceae bacterium]|nr:1-acyl-sn-glycerol-3-phosphate acyltransferase [Lachnospiraceae bacterium]